MVQRVLIAGCGYVGESLARLLQLQGVETIFAVRRGDGAAASQTPGLERVQWIAADLAAAQNLPTGLERIYMTAAPDDSSVGAYVQIYERALSRLLDHLVATGAPGARLLLTSSTSVYGQTLGEWVDETSPAQPSSPQSQVIVRGEQLLRPQDCALRLGGIYGPGRTSFIDGVRAGTLLVNAEGSAFTNRIHRDDAARALVYISRLGAPAPRYNGVDSCCATRFEVAQWLSDQLRVPLKKNEGSEPSSSLRGHKRVSNQRLLAAGFEFAYPSYKEGYASLM